jgi:DNA-binding MarR family transcriptional regulator
MRTLGSEQIDRDLTVQALRLHRVIFRALQTQAGEEWSQLPFTMAQVKALFAIANLGPVSIGSVAKALGVAVPTASVGVDGLVAQGLVERREDPLDRRRTLAKLTVSGESLVNRLRQGSLQLMTAALRRLGEPELSDLVSGLTALSAAIEAEVERAPPVVAVSALSSKDG